MFPKSLAITISFICLWTLGHGQRFPCDGQLLIATTDGFSTSISRPVYAPFAPPFLSPWARYFGENFEALGFNSLDNYIYAVQHNSNNIVRLQRGSQFEVIGSVDVVDTLRAKGGDVTPQGLYVIHEPSLDQLLVFSVVDNFELLYRIDLYWNPDAGIDEDFSTVLYDLAFDPNNPQVAYAYQNRWGNDNDDAEEAYGFLLSINMNFDDPRLGMVSPFTEVDSFAISRLDGLLFSPRSELFGVGSADPDSYPLQERLFGINPYSGNVIPDLSVMSTEISDGCSCPYSFTFSCAVPTEGMYCNNDMKNFYLVINNNSYNDLDDLVLTDTFPQGIIIEEVSELPDGSVVSGVGSNILTINNLDVVGKSRLEIKVRTRSIDASVGEVENQAFLANLPERFSGVWPSDDLGTAGVEQDASRFLVLPMILTDVTWEVQSPTDCMEANDGQMRVASPMFVEGQSYEIKIRNKVGWTESTYTTVIDREGAFVFDSLLPGEYQIFDIKSMTDNCSLAIKDTTVILDAPNDLLSVNLSNNGPICAGTELSLQADIMPAGDIDWRGPSLFGSEDSNPIITNTDTTNTGMYSVEVEYGYCTQRDTMEVIVYPLIESAIVGDSVLCERDSFQLSAVGAGENLQHVWSLPDYNVSYGENLYYPSASMEMEGYYELVTDNGACRDTSGIYVNIKTTPEISMEESVLTDYCTPLVLSPEIIGVQNATYQWSPSLGIDCPDCPSVELVPPVQREYSLSVANDNGCQDSTTVEILLDKSNLVYAPNIFISDLAGDNGRYRIFPGCLILRISSFGIYDRWGNLVFESLSDESGELIDDWSGYYRGLKSEGGQYIWSATLELVDGSTEYVQGSLVMMGGG